MLFYLYDRKSTRFIGSWLNGIIVFVSGVMALGVVGLSGVAYFLRGSVSFIPLRITLFVLLILECYLSFRTFYPEVSLGPNSALQNLPLLFVDLSLACIINNAYIPKFLELYYFKELLRLDHVAKFLILVPMIIRYMGLAWTDEKFILKRLICPIRYEKQLDEVTDFI